MENIRSDKEQSEIVERIISLSARFPAQTYTAVDTILHDIVERWLDQGIHVFSPLSTRRLEQLLPQFSLEKKTSAFNSSLHAIQLMAGLMSPDILSRNFKKTFSLGELAVDLMPVLFGEHLFHGFSGYKAEECHEYLNGNQSCGALDGRDGLCGGTLVILQERGNSINEMHDSKTCLSFLAMSKTITLTHEKSVMHVF